MDFARYAITRPVNIWILVLTCLLGGILAFFEIGRLEDPEFTIKQAIVNVQYPGATALEVEQQVTEPLESAIQQMSQIKEIRSRSMPGIAEIRVEMQDRYDGDALPQIWDELRNKINDAQGDLPPGIEPPQVNDDFGDVYGIFYALTGDGLTLKRTARNGQRPAPRAAHRRWRRQGGDRRRAGGTHPGGGRSGAAGGNEHRPGRDRRSAGRYRCRGGGRRRQRRRFLRAPQRGVRFSGGAARTVGRPGSATGRAGRHRQLARLRRAAAADHPPQRPAGADAGYQRVSGANIVEVGHSVEAVLQANEHRMPLGAELHALYEQHRIVDESVNSFALNVFLSVAIVVGVLCIAMGLRAGVIIGAVLFLTVLGTLLVMWLAGIELERISSAR